MAACDSLQFPIRENSLRNIVYYYIYDAVTYLAVLSHAIWVINFARLFGLRRGFRQMAAFLKRQS